MFKKQLVKLNDLFITVSVRVVFAQARFKRSLANQYGNQWIDFGLQVLIISLPLAVAGLALAGAISGKYTSLVDVLDDVPIPSL